jgi:hypothetical protein
MHYWKIGITWKKGLSLLFTKVNRGSAKLNPLIREGMIHPSILIIYKSQSILDELLNDELPVSCVIGSMNPQTSS